jgi:hypothetical protein
MSGSDWEWMPHPAHWICGSACRFHLATVVNHCRILVSTVGELPKEGQDKYAPVEFETVGAGSHCYETMVFVAVRSKNGCCRYHQIPGSSLDCVRSLTPEDARKTHMRLCKKWDRRSLRKVRSQSDEVVMIDGKVLK